MKETINKIINIHLLTEDYCIDKNKLMQIKDQSAPDPVKICNDSCIVDYLHKCIIQLTEKEQWIVILRNGLFGYKKLSISKVADFLGYKSIESIRQIEHRTYRKLRHPRFKLWELINEN